MEKDEKFILSNYGKENHFKVPEGYFEAFDEKLLHNLPHIDMQPGNAKVEKPLAKVVAMPHRSGRIVNPNTAGLAETGRRASRQSLCQHRNGQQRRVIERQYGCAVRLYDD